MTRWLWAVATLMVVACRGDGIVAPEPRPLTPGASERMVAVDEDGVPIYPYGTVGGFIDADTWLKIDPSWGFHAQAGYSISALMHSVIRGHSSTGFNESSDNGLSIGVAVATKRSYANLPVPPDKRDCQASAVTLSGSAEHTVSYKVSTTIGGVGVDATYQFDSRDSHYPDQSCEHLPVGGSFVAPAHLDVGQSGTIAVFWQWKSGTDACATSWASQGAVSLLPAAGSGDAQTVTGLYNGTGTVTATCHGVSVSYNIAVGATSPPPEGGGTPDPEEPTPTGEYDWPWPYEVSAPTVTCEKMEYHYLYDDGSVSDSWYAWQCDDGTQYPA